MRHYTVAVISDDVEATPQRIVASGPMPITDARSRAWRYADSHPRTRVGLFRGQACEKLIETYWSKGAE